MHEREKSDPAIGARKPANEAAPAVEERVEQRAGAKGNASGQSTHRTQSRGSVSQALERVRTKARGRKTESSPRSCTTSTTSCSANRFTLSSVRRRPAWTA